MDAVVGDCHAGGVVLGQHRALGDQPGGRISRPGLFGLVFRDIPGSSPRE